MLVDTHCHLDAKYFRDGPDAPIARARASGVGFFMVVGVGSTLEPAREAIALAARRDDVRAVVGVHPHDAAVLDDAMLDELATLAADPHVVAVGEMGLDYHYMRSPRDAQARAFRAQIAIARAVKKPIVVHTREAPDDTIALLKDEGARDVGGVIHCFSEDRAFAERALDLDFDLSFSGIVTFKTATAIQDVAAWAPIDRVLVETDAPYLAPVPLRGKPCEPAYVAHTARFVAKLRNQDDADFAARTTENAQRRFRLPT
jgi:TatD DNase family protein